METLLSSLVLAVLLLATSPVTAWAGTYHCTFAFSSTAAGNGPALRDGEAALGIWIETATRDAGTSLTARPEVIDFSDAVSARQRLEAPQTYVVGLNAMEFFEVAEPAGFVPAYVPLHETGTPYTRLILVAAAARAKQGVAGLRGARLVPTTTREEPVSALWLDVLVRETVGLSRSEFFDIAAKALPMQRAVLEVFFGSSDACVVTREVLDLMSELNPAVGRSLTVVAESEPLLCGFVAVRNDCPPDLRADFARLLLTFGTSPQADQVLKIFRMDALGRFEPEHLTTIRQLWRRSLK